MVEFSEDEEGKTVVNSVGDEVGIVSVVKDGRPYVKPDPNWTDRIRIALDWNDDPDVNEYPLEDDHIEEITDTQVILRQDLQTDRSGA